MKAALRDVLETALLTLVIFLGVRLGVQTFRVEGFSMEPSLHTNQYLLINKVAYLFGAPQRGDIVVFRMPQDPGRDLIKRVIALPGDEVEVRDGSVFVNGKGLAEPYISDKPRYDYAKRRVPPSSYFVLGDNRNNSYDSHVWDWLPKNYLIGRAWVSYWPSQSCSLLPSGSVHFATAPAASREQADSPPLAA